MKKILAAVLAVTMLISAVLLIACTPKKEQSEVQKIIEQAQSMSLEELGKKAIEESKGKSFAGVGNSSRGQTALPYFISWLQTIDPSYTLEFSWQQPKENSIFEMLDADSKKAQGTFAMTLIQDGNQIESKMVQTGILDRFIPKQWAEANGTTADKYEGYLSLQLLNKVFMFNCVDTSKTYTNVWDFVREGEHGLFMGLDSEPVGKNFLLMLTQPAYAKDLKAAYDAMPDGAEKTRVQATADGLDAKAKELKLDENGKYALAWIKLWVESFNQETDDGPICKTLTNKSAAGKFGLLVYSKLRSTEESAEVSKNNVKVAAYEDGYKGFGGYGYCHYLFVTDNSPLPWTACAFIAYMTCVNESAVPESYKPDAENRADNWKIAGFEAWGRDPGGYSYNPQVRALNEQVFKHANKGGTEFPVVNDKGYDWWKSHLIIEDPEYCAKVAFTVGAWIDGLNK